MSATTDVLLLSGEKSGDQLALALLKDIQEQHPNLRIAGMGGETLKQAGMNILVDNSDLSIIGFIEVVKKIGSIWRAWKKLKRIVKQQSPLVILIDYPGMNLRFAKLAKKNNCRVLYYVSPQIWAWKAYRLKTIQRCVDHIAVFFPFEKKIYDEADVPCTVVGHPLTKKHTRCDQADLAARLELGFAADPPLIALCPGSRSGEITTHLPLILESVELIRQQLPDAQFALLCASKKREALLINIPPYVKIIHNSGLSNLFRAADAGIAVSGTITLEAACHQLPITVIYHVSAFNYWLGKKLIKTPYIALCNVVCQKELVKELIQHDASAEKISTYTITLLTNKNSRLQMGEIFTHLPPASHQRLLPIIAQLLKQ